MTANHDLPAHPGWRPRLAALADAQSRYFYLLGASGVFFLALFAGLGADSSVDTTLLLRVQLSTALVIATGPTVLGFLIQAVTGAIIATDSAAWRMAVLEEVDFEREHIAPSAIDLAFYTTDRSPALVRACRLLIYPAYLTVFWVEGLWLEYWLLQGAGPSFEGLIAVRWTLFALGLAFLVTALPRLVFLWWRKLSHASVLLRHKNTPVMVSAAMSALADISDSLRGAGRKVESAFEGRRYRFYVDEECVAWGRSLQEVTVRTRQWADRQASEADSGPAPLQDPATGDATP